MAHHVDHATASADYAEGRDQCITDGGLGGWLLKMWMRISPSQFRTVSAEEQKKLADILVRSIEIPKNR